jgi:TolA-binding protein
VLSDELRREKRMRRGLIMMVLLTGICSTPVVGQSDGLALRIDKIEKEMKAVQRKVFPNGQPIQPELGAPPETQPALANGASAVSELTSRVDALETRVRTLTGQLETQSNQLSKLEAANKAMDARVKALEVVAPAKSASDGIPEVEAAPAAAPKPFAAATPKPVAIAPKPATVPKPVDAKKSLAAADLPATKTAPLAGKTDPKLKARIDSVEIPRTGDAPEDAYVYGFRLWQAKLYPEAQKQFQTFIQKYPKHRRASYSGNLLGRAFLDEGKSANAAVAFYQNYKRDPNGERAPESLYYVGYSLTKLKRLTDACKAFDEFREVYGATAPSDLKSKVAVGRTEAKCAA